MKKYNFFKALVFAGALFTLGACSDSDDARIFDEDPIHRLSEAETKLKNELVSSEHGWVVDFFPNNEIFGGYSFLFDFNEDGTVKTRSDAKVNDYGIKDEKYNFVLLGTLALNFPSFSTVHEFPKLSQGGNDGANVYHTDYEFLFERFDGDDIVFKGFETRNEIRFKRATADDKEFVLTTKHAMLNAVSGMRTLITFDNGEANTYNFRYGSGKRYATVLSADRTMSVNANGGVGVGASNSGIIISPTIEFEDGSTLSELALDGNRFVGEVNGNMVIIQ